MPESSHPPAVEAREVTKHFGGTVALNKASFYCQPGSIHALIGENGAGKSTLIKIFAGGYVGLRRALRECTALYHTFAC